LKKSILDAGFTTKEVSAYCEWTEEIDGATCGIRYADLISLNIHEIQKLKKRVADLEAQIKELKSKN
jgi:cell division protein FtsB